MTALTLTALLALLLAGPSVVGAASFTLEPQQQNDALRVGAQSTTRDSFDTEWRVANPAGDSLTVITPFHRLVLAARNAAFKNERTAIRTDGGGYLARCIYGFPVAEIAPKSRLILVVRDSDGRDVSRFTIDLASMR